MSGILRAIFATIAVLVVLSDKTGEDRFSTVAANCGCAGGALLLLALDLGSAYSQRARRFLQRLGCPQTRFLLFIAILLGFGTAAHSPAQSGIVLGEAAVCLSVFLLGLDLSSLWTAEWTKRRRLVFVPPGRNGRSH